MGRTSSGAASIVGTLVACLVAACSSLPDLHFTDAADAEGGVGPDSGFDGGTPPACKTGAPEICNDGFDNDCNLLVDCKDGACTAQGFACQTVPAGWTAVRFSATDRGSCGPGETALDLKVAAGDSTATCHCTCTSAGGSCAAGNFTVTSASDVACAMTPTTTTVPVDNGACAALGSNIALSTRAMATPPAGPTSCTVASALNGALTDGRLCQPPGTGGGCGSGQVCAQSSAGGGGLSSCITTSGKSACPPEFPKRSTAGTDATDSRTCGGCACGAPNPCSGGSVSLYDNVMCKSNGVFGAADNIGATCAALSPSSGFTATHFKSTPPSGGCGAPTSQGVVTGGVAFTNERTVCCK